MYHHRIYSKLIEASSKWTNLSSWRTNRNQMKPFEISAKVLIKCGYAGVRSEGRGWMKVSFSEKVVLEDWEFMAHSHQISQQNEVRERFHLFWMLRKYPRMCLRMDGGAKNIFKREYFNINMKNAIIISRLLATFFEWRRVQNISVLFLPVLICWLRLESSYYPGG